MKSRFDLLVTEFISKQKTIEVCEYCIYYCGYNYTSMFNIYLKNPEYCFFVNIKVSLMQNLYISDKVCWKIILKIKKCKLFIYFELYYLIFTYKSYEIQVDDVQVKILKVIVFYFLVQKVL